MKNITVIGGGTGLSILLRGIKKLDNINLSAIVTVADDGGSSGILREDLGMLPPGDIRSCLLALANEEESLSKILAYRFDEGLFAGQNIGNLIIAAAVDIYGNFEKGVESISDILQVKGKVLPVCNDNINLCARLENGNIVIGESAIPKAAVREKSRIEELFLDKYASITESVYNSIVNSDILIFGPGSLYTSIIPNLLVDGMNECISKNEAPKVYIGNVMTQPGETLTFDFANHIEKLCEYFGDNQLDYVIANSTQLSNNDLNKYLSDGSKQLIANDDDKRRISNLGIKLIEGDIIEIKKGYIRHDCNKVAKIIDDILAKHQ